MVRLIERGVGGLVTNAPEVVIRIRRDRAELSDVERRLLAARYLLGLESSGESAEPRGAAIRDANAGSSR